MEFNRLVTYKHDYSSFDERSFISDFNKLELSYIDIDTDINGNYNKFSQDINMLVEKHVPVKKCTKKESKIKAKLGSTVEYKKWCEFVITCLEK